MTFFNSLSSEIGGFLLYKLSIALTSLKGFVATNRIWLTFVGKIQEHRGKQGGT